MNPIAGLAPPQFPATIIPDGLIDTYALIRASGPVEFGEFNVDGPILIPGTISATQLSALWLQSSAPGTSPSGVAGVFLGRLAVSDGALISAPAVWVDMSDAALGRVFALNGPPVDGYRLVTHVTPDVVLADSTVIDVHDLWVIEAGEDDCNGNGINDLDDIAAGTSQDCNGNGVPDECEGDESSTYSKDAGLPIPDDGGFDDVVTSTITVTDSFQIFDLNVELLIDHTWNGDLWCRLTHNGVSVVLIDRPGAPDPEGQNGFADEGFDIVLDDEGPTPIEFETADGLAVVSPPSYAPNEQLAAFDGMDASGDWTLEVADFVSADSGILLSWGLQFNALDCPNDCNENGIADEIDILSGFSEDCNENFMPDECEVFLPDESFFSGARQPFDDANPQTVTINAPPQFDGSAALTVSTNADLGQSHEYVTVLINDVEFGRLFEDEDASDCDSRSASLAISAAEYEVLAQAPITVQLIPSGTVDPGVCPLASVSFVLGSATATAPNDCNANGVPDDCEPDCDGDGVPDGCEFDCDSDGIPDDCEDDCDGDGIPDDCEPDCDGDGIPDDCEPDCDGDGIPDDCDPLELGQLDCNANGLPDDCEIANGLVIDCDGNGIPDECDGDCDGDGIADVCELDCDGNGIPDECEMLDPADDCNANGVSDACELLHGFLSDCNGDGIPDECDPPFGISQTFSPDESAWFGVKVRASHDWAIVGDHYQLGGVSFLRRTAEGWALEQQLDDPSGESFVGFGLSLDVRGSLAIVGSPYFGDGDDEGRAYIFEFNGAEWVHQATLVPNVPVANHNFGGSVALSDGTTDQFAFVRVSSQDGGVSNGAVHVFRRDGDSWTRTQILADPEGAAGDSFGSSMAFGPGLLIGVPGQDEGAINLGEVQHFTLDGAGDWTLAHTLRPTELSHSRSFGRLVAADADTLAVTGSFSAGRLWVFEYDAVNNSWNESTVMGPDYAVDNRDLAIAGDLIVSGEPFANVHDLQWAGETVIYKKGPAGWSHARTLSYPDPAAFDYFGNGVALAGDELLIGAYGRDNGGELQVFKGLQDVCRPAADLTLQTVPSQSATASQPLTLNWTVENIGDGEDFAWWIDEVWLSTDDALNTDTDTLLGSFIAHAPIAAGDVYSNEITFNAPDLEGPYHILIRLDAMHQLDEIDGELNNLVAIDLVVGAKPNLVPESAGSTSPIAQGGSGTIDFRVRNDGAAIDAGAGWRDRIYVTQDGVITPDQPLAERSRVGPLAADAVYDTSLPVTLPPDVTGGAILTVVTDALDAIDEGAGEADNRQDFPIAILTPPIADAGPVVSATHDMMAVLDATASVDPDGTGDFASDFAAVQWDLGADGLDGADPSLTQSMQPIDTAAAVAKGLRIGVDLPVGLTVTDQDGLTDSATTAITYASTAPTADAGGPYSPVAPGASLALAGAVVDPDLMLNVGDVITLEWDSRPLSESTIIGDGLLDSTSGSIPYDTLVDLILDGRSTLHLNARDSVGLTATASTVFQVLHPDLRVQVVTNVQNAPAGSTITVEWVTENIGDAAATATWSESVYLSEDEFLDGDDDLLGTIPTPGPLGPGETRPMSLDVTLPDLLGSYRIIVVADIDDDVEEVLAEANNETATLSTFTAFADCNGNGQPDDLDIATMASADCNANGVPDECEAMLVYAEDFEGLLGSEWSDRSTLDGSYPDSYTRFSGRFSNNSQTLTLATSPGVEYELRFDLYTIRTWDGDGCGCCGPDWIRVRQDGALVFNHTFHASQTCQSYPYDPDVINVPGWGTDGDIYRDVTVSFTATGSTTTLRFSGENLQGVNDEAWGLDNVRITTPGLSDCNGNGQLDACDIDLGVSLDDNGNRIPDECEDQPDLSPLTLNLSGPATTGATVAFDWTVTNLGNAIAETEAWTDRIYLRPLGSTDAPISVGSATRTGPVAASGTYAVTADVTLPPDVGMYEIFVVVNDDEGLFEFGADDNNRIDLDPPLDVALSADLVCLEAQPLSSLVDGSIVTLSWTVRNDGGVAAAGWSDRLRLISADGQDERIIGVSTPAGAIQPGQSITLIEDFTLPADIDGPWRLAVTVDAGDDVTETPNESNNDFESPDLIDIATTDLAARELRVIGVGETLAPLEISWRVLNDSPKNVTDAWTDVVYLQAGDADVLDPATPPLFTRTWTADLAAGAQTDVHTESLMYPPTGGTYRVFVVVNESGDVYEGSNAANNTLVSSPFEVRYVERPDLLVENITPPAPAAEGETIDVAFSVTNAGDAPVNATWRESIEASSDGQSWTGFAVVDVMETIPAGQTIPRSRAYTIPALPTGSLWLRVRLDVQDDLFELDETNNVAVVEVCSDCLSANLRVASVEPDVSSAVAGQPLALTWEIENDGSLAATQARKDRFWLSLDDQLDAADLPLGDVGSVNAIAPGSSDIRTDTLTIPLLALGDYHIICVADATNAVPEVGGEGDNEGVSAQLVTIAAPDAPDLVAIDVSTTQSSVPAGESIIVNWTGRNDGTAAAIGTWIDAIYLSSDDVFDPDDDEPLGDRLIQGPLSPDAPYQADEAVQIPYVEPGDYRLIIAVDRGEDIDELHAEGNNVYISPSPITITAPPLPDLIVTNITPPANAVPGSQVEIRYTVRNIGLGPAFGDWNETIASSLNDIEGDGDDEIETTVVGSGPILPGESRQRAVTMTAPDIPAGDYWIIICVDSDSELDETDDDNCVIEQVCANCDAPDLIVVNVDAPDTGVAGEGVTVTWTVDNLGLGVADGTWIDRILLSDTMSPDGATLLAEFRHFSPLDGADDVNAETTYTTGATVVLPDEVAGPYHIVVVTDAYNELPEPGGESNNFAADPDPIDVALPDAPDLVVTDVAPAASADPPIFGQPVTIEWTVANNGTTPADGAWFDRILLSDDAARGIDDFPLTIADAALTPLPDGQSYHASATFDMPLRSDLPPGMYHFIVIADSGLAVTEQIESNNWRSSTAVQIDRPPLPDLRVTSVSTPPPAAPGETVTVIWTTANEGDLDLTGSWTERVFVSTDDVFGNDFFGAELDVIDESLVAGQTVTRQAQITVPSTGLDYRIFVCADVDSEIFESDEDNNCARSDARAIIHRADMTVDSVSVLNAPVLADGLIDVQWLTRNAGNDASSGSFIDGVYLVNPDGSATLLGTHVHSGAFQPGQVTPTIKSFNVPGRIEGLYSVRVRTDLANDLLEPDESNNTRVTPAPIVIDQPPRANLMAVVTDAPTAGLISGESAISYMVLNIGDADAASPWTERIVARSTSGGPDVFLGLRQQSADLARGDTYDVTDHPINLPADPDEYEICVVVDGSDMVNEGLDGGEDDNRACASASLVTEGFVVTVTPSITDGLAGTPVEASGQSLTFGGAPLPNAAAWVDLRVRNTLWRERLTTDDEGFYAFTLPLQNSEAGRFRLNAGPPDNVDPDAVSEFTLHRLLATPRFTGLRVVPGDSDGATGVIELFNAGDDPLTGLNFRIEDAPAGLTFDLDLQSTTIPGRTTISPRFTLTASEDAPDMETTVRIVWETSQGATDDTRLDLRIAPPGPRLVANPPSLAAAMTLADKGPPGEPDILNPVEVAFEITNIGGSETGPVNVVLPGGVSHWMALNSPAQIPSLAPEESATIELTLAPPVQLQPQSGQLAVNGSGFGVGVPFDFSISNTREGVLYVEAENEDTYWNEDAGFPKVGGARVTVRDVNGNIVAITETDTSGRATDLPPLPEGFYSVKVQSDRHTTFQRNVEVKRDDQTDVTAFLQRRGVTYSWTVDPVQIEDRYRFILEAEFVTNVYKPVLDVTVYRPLTDTVSRDIFLDEILEEEQFDLRIENKGLIDSFDTWITVADSEGWEIELLGGDIGVLPPGPANAVTIPFVVRRKGLGRGDVNYCSPPSLGANSYVPCGDNDSIDRYPISMRSPSCPDAPLDLGPGPGGSGGTPSGGSNAFVNDNPPVSTTESSCEPCDETDFRSETRIVCVDEEAMFTSPSCGGNEIRWSIAGIDLGDTNTGSSIAWTFEEPSGSKDDIDVIARCNCNGEDRVLAHYLVTAAEVEITLLGQVANQRIDDDKYFAVIGQKVTLLADVTPPDLTVETVQWSIGGTTFLSYQPTIAAAVEPDRFGDRPDLLNSVEVGPFAWSIPSTSNPVDVEVTFEGGTCGANIEVESREPASPSQLRFFAQHGRQVLKFPFTIDNVEIVFLKEFIETGFPINFSKVEGFDARWNEVFPSGVVGQYGIFQVIDFTASASFDRDGKCLQRLSATNKLDAGIPLNGTPGRYGDSPSISANKRLHSKITRETRFSTYLMWRPSNGCWVPLRRIKWGICQSASLKPLFVEPPEVARLSPPIPITIDPDALIWELDDSSYPDSFGVWTSDAAFDLFPTWQGRVQDLEPADCGEDVQ